PRTRSWSPASASAPVRRSARGLERSSVHAVARQAEMGEYAGREIEQRARCLTYAPGGKARAPNHQERVLFVARETAVIAVAEPIGRLVRGYGAVTQPGDAVLVGALVGAHVDREREAAAVVRVEAGGAQ